VTARRYRCLKYHRTCRVYPTGVSQAHPSDTLKGLSVLLYILGLSYQGGADLLDALHYPLSKTTVYENGQAAGQPARRLRQVWVRQRAGQVKVLGLDFTHMKCNGQEKIVAVATAVLTGEPLDFDLVPSESALHTAQWIHDLARLVGAEIVVTDDADGLKTVANNLALQQPICRAHVNRNVQDLIGALGEKALGRPDAVPWESKSRVQRVSVDQFLEDLQTAEFVITALPADGQLRLEQLVQRYQFAPLPSQGH
jgi:transposase-like protein